MREQKVKRGYCQALNAQEAMVQAAQHMKAAKEQAAVAAQNPNIGIILARPALEKAVNYGCLDGVCGLAEVLGKTGNMELERVSTDMYRIAAYMGHSYAMYQMGQYYDEISKETADACYRQAALWEYQPAVDVCAERNISLG